MFPGFLMVFDGFLEFPRLRNPWKLKCPNTDVVGASNGPDWVPLSSLSEIKTNVRRDGCKESRKACFASVGYAPG